MCKQCLVDRENNKNSLLNVKKKTLTIKALIYENIS